MRVEIFILVFLIFIMGGMYYLLVQRLKHIYLYQKVCGYDIKDSQRVFRYYFLGREMGENDTTGKGQALIRIDTREP
jgi:K+-transporting ATPase c subunit